MSEQYPNESGGPADEIRRQGAEVVGQTQQDAEAVVRHAGEEAGSVVDTARREVRDVVDEASDAIAREADERTRQAGGALHELSDDLHHMAESANGSTAAQYVDAVANSVGRLASTLEEGGSRGALDSLRSTASRRPGSFISGAAMAGFVVGRMIRNSDTDEMRHAMLDSNGDGSGHRDRYDESVDDQYEIDRQIDLRSQSGSESAEQQRQDHAPQPDLTTVGAGQVPGSIPPPPPPGAMPERF